MNRHYLPSVASALLTLLAVTHLTANELSDSEQFNIINRGAVVFAARLSKVQPGPVARSLPPIYTFRLTFEMPDNALRGIIPEDGSFHFSHRGDQPPALTVGDRYLIVANRPAEPGDARATSILPETDDLLATARRAVSLPIGWTLVDDKPTSPWAARGDRAWPKRAAPTAKEVCARTGRPALLCGDKITITVEQVPPEKLKEFQNPFGDGQFKVTVTNTGKAAAEVPALLKKGDQIAWPESLIILHDSEPLILPVHKPLADPRPVELAAGESVHTTIDTLLLPDSVQWPRGGSRVYFTFALGEIAADHFFYYFSDLHDSLRADRQRDFSNKNKP